MERRKQVEDSAQRILLEMALQELHQSRHLTQQQLPVAYTLTKPHL